MLVTMPNSMRWLADEVIQLIHLVKIDEAIYNPRHINYFCRPYIENFWRDIDLKLGKNAGSSLSKWTNLRISFRREYQVHLTEKVQPSWIFYDKMLFLSPFLRKKRNQIEGIEPHIQEALEQMNSMNRGNYKSFVESIERCGGSTESVIGEERQTPDVEEEIIWDGIKEEIIEHDDSSEQLENPESFSEQSKSLDDRNEQQISYLKRVHSSNSMQFNNDNDNDNSHHIPNKKFIFLDKSITKLPPTIIKTFQLHRNGSDTTNANGIVNGVVFYNNEHIQQNQNHHHEMNLLSQPQQQSSTNCQRPSPGSNEIDNSMNRTDESMRREDEIQTVPVTNHNCTCNTDPDSMFLMSLLPDIQSLTRRDKGKLKIEIQKVVQNFLYPD